MHKTLKTTLAGLAVSTMLSTAVFAQTAEVIHWWTSGGESAALNTFADKFKEQGGTWVDNAVAGGSNARTAAITRAVGGDPATMWQFNTGKQFDDLVAQGMLRNLDEIAEAGGWREFLPQAFIDATTRDGHFYALPVNVHGQSWLWYNKPLFEEIGAPVPDTWENFWKAGDMLKEAGKIPVAYSAQMTWDRHTFTHFLLYVGGRDFFLKVFRDHDEDAIRSDTFREAAEAFRRLHDYVDEGAPARKQWSDATNLVITGEAGMQFMGDWAKGEWVAANKVAGVDYGCVLGPGDPAFLMGGDVFVFSKTDDPDELKAQNMLAEIMISPEGQVNFNNKKGSVPVRQDVETSAMDECAQVGIEVMGDPGQQIPGTNLLLSPDLRGALGDLMSEYWNDPSMSTDDFVDRFVEEIELAS